MGKEINIVTFSSIVYTHALLVRLLFQIMLIYDQQDWVDLDVCVNTYNKRTIYDQQTELQKPG